MSHNVKMSHQILLFILTLLFFIDIEFTIFNLRIYKSLQNKTKTLLIRFTIALLCVEFESLFRGFPFTCFTNFKSTKIFF